MVTVSANIKFDQEKDSVITLAGGCFWGTERLFRSHFSGRITDLRVGYANGLDKFEELSYEQVCSGETEFTEVLQITYPKENSETFKNLIQFFFKVHDPTTFDKQGEDDVGKQYRSAIFYHDDSQIDIINQVIEEFNPKWDNKIVTVVEKINNWFDAEDYHQNYYETDLANERNWAPCSTHFVRDI
ncbi:hypothetical protein BN7_222 [Wickerhamomyces ciferrii]|uniref:peptide-methionine (S)-S-oxide reductase n=1 Tax=Wickerhamomyces ciferrii (strain ATCC 14091 / BCRC 22168 / CBS 111 / JCM 3599 / NBRC 0793 / NRRL Y-1031 F-60-10) TaxID=1206466 RepID=K0KHQ0_WICCF|nr:uncharacterized protein BN7_222 [Wickerhamomyces ciferrii]CCH40688.1 hypothetical protein BN7_222 [Wickerhamomyces ciferrii]